MDRQIREAQERGDFDNLPGAGKPLGDLGDPNDAEWWVRRYIEREKLDVSGALPTPLALRKEAASFPDSLVDVRGEAEVREILEDFNRRVKVDRLRPAVGAMPPLLARTVDVAATLAHLAGGSVDDMDGVPVDLATPGARHVVGLLWDGAPSAELLALAADGTLSNVARLLEPYGDGTYHGKLLKRTRKQLRSVSSREALTVPFLFRRSWGAA